MSIKVGDKVRVTLRRFDGSPVFTDPLTGEVGAVLSVPLDNDECSDFIVKVGEDVYSLKEKELELVKEDR